MVETKQSLLRKLRAMDGKSYGHYKDLAGEYDFGPFRLAFEHVQSDPYAPPSRIRLTIGHHFTGVEEAEREHPVRRLALEDYILREAYTSISEIEKRNRGKERATIRILAPGQTVLKRSAVIFTENGLEVRLTIGLPAKGRSIMAKECERMLEDDLTLLVDRAFNIRNFDLEKLERHLELLAEQVYLRHEIRNEGLVAFIGNGSRLARETGISDKPLADGIVIESPESLEIELQLPTGRTIRGMGIPAGVTLIVGGGFHGKSTLLKAIERGVYNHIEGDGREYVITDDSAVKIRAEEGRHVGRVDISPFISDLPQGKSTAGFSTGNASGSTSQAANIAEAMEMGSQVLLLDEDTSATNFMIRDARMQSLVAKEREPITPFIDRIRELYERFSISTILVVGGVGDYLDTADLVIEMNEYHPFDVTPKARKIAVEFPSNRHQEKVAPIGEQKPRFPQPLIIYSGERAIGKISAKDQHLLMFGEELVRLDAVEQLADEAQTRFIAAAIRYAVTRQFDGSTTLREIAEKIIGLIEKKGFAVISPYQDHYPGTYAVARPFELAAVMNRIRFLKFRDNNR